MLLLRTTAPPSHPVPLHLARHFALRPPLGLGHEGSREEAKAGGGGGEDEERAWPMAPWAMAGSLSCLGLLALIRKTRIKTVAHPAS